MSHVLVIAAFAAGLGVAVAKGILGKEIQGRLERRIMRSVEATIASLPDTLQDEYAEEWRAELAVTLAMPLSAAMFAHGLRRSATVLVGDAAVAPAAEPRARRSPRELLAAPWHRIARLSSAVVRILGHNAATIGIALVAVAVGAGLAAVVVYAPVATFAAVIVAVYVGDITARFAIARRRRESSGGDPPTKAPAEAGRPRIARPRLDR